jgi:preprotein translocase subunit SecF
MELIRPGMRIDFIGYRNYAYAVSGLLIGISLISIFFWKGLNFGIDFSGGLELQVAFSTSISTEDVRKSLASIGFEDARIQSVGSAQGSEFLIRLLKISDNPKESELSKIQNTLFSVFGKNKVDIRRAEVVGSEVSKDLKQKGFLSSLEIRIQLFHRRDPVPGSRYHPHGGYFFPDRQGDIADGNCSPAHPPWVFPE